MDNVRIGNIVRARMEKVTVVFATEGQEYRSSVIETTMNGVLRRLRNNAMWAMKEKKKVWFYIFDEATNTWTRSQKWRYFNNNMLPSDKEIEGVKVVPELEIAHLENEK
jgi:hypothetical protein